MRPGRSERAERLGVARRQVARATTVDTRERIGELALALLDDPDALRELALEPSQLLLRRDANRVQPLLFRPDRGRFVLTTAK